MSNEVNILLYNKVGITERFAAATKIINDYNLPLTETEILVAFKKARSSDRRSYYALSKEIHTFLFNTLLNTNTNMLIAIVKLMNTCSDKRAEINLTNYVSCRRSFRIGYKYNYGTMEILRYYSRLLDYGDFSVDDLKLNNGCKYLINKYRNEKYCWAKLAIKMN